MSADSVELAELLRQHRPGVAQEGFPAWLRERTAEYVLKRRDDGASLGVLAAELGVSRTTLAHWARALSPSLSKGFSRVMVEGAIAPVSAVGSSEAVPIVRSELRVTSPHGFSIEGVSLAEALHALAVLR